jgi:hypothetical protein
MGKVERKMIELALISIKGAFLKAMYGKRDFTKEGRTNEFLASGFDNIICGLEGISIEYTNKEMNYHYIKGKIERIKHGVEDLEKILNILE